MPEEVALQALTQAAESIQNLFELSTRIDERMKSLQSQHDAMAARFEVGVMRQMDILEKLAILEFKSNDNGVPARLADCERLLADMDKRLANLEGTQGRQADRWNKFASFVIQLAWVILAAYLLTKAQLQPPLSP